MRYIQPDAHDSSADVEGSPGDSTPTRAEDEPMDKHSLHFGERVRAQKLISWRSIGARTASIGHMAIWDEYGAAP